MISWATFCILSPNCPSVSSVDLKSKFTANVSTKIWCDTISKDSLASLNNKHLSLCSNSLWVNLHHNSNNLLWKRCKTTTFWAAQTVSQVSLLLSNLIFRRRRIWKWDEGCTNAVEVAKNARTVPSRWAYAMIQIRDVRWWCYMRVKLKQFFIIIPITLLSLKFKWVIAVDHTKPNAPDPIRTPKLSGLRHG